MLCFEILFCLQTLRGFEEGFLLKILFDLFEKQIRNWNGIKKKIAAVLVFLVSALIYLQHKWTDLLWPVVVHLCGSISIIRTLTYLLLLWSQTHLVNDDTLSLAKLKVKLSILYSF